MAHHKSALKRIRQSAKRRLENRYYSKSTRTALKNFFLTSKKADADKITGEVSSMVDKLVKRNVIHRNKAAHIKSRMSRHTAAL